MERKIGEIFEHNGEWYQCVEDTEYSRCINCCFYNGGHKLCTDKDMGNCAGEYRSDEKYICFKKLKKVGEPYDDCGTMLQRFKIYTNVTNVDMEELEFHIYSNNTIGIEIKQNKEDMKDNRTINQHFAECGQTINDVVQKCYTENKSTQIKDMEEYKMHDAKEDIPEFDKVVDECLFGKDKLNLKPFNLEKAKAGKPVYTRDGRKARIICFDAKRKDEKSIIALVPSKDYPGFEDLIAYPNNGNYYGGHENDGDLMMLPEKKEGWVNVYDADTTFRFVEGMVYNTKDEAIQRAKEEVTNGQREKNEYVDTVKICWEE